MTREVGYTIRAMAAHCKLTAHTLRYYERVGLIQPVERARNGHRRYSDEDAAWLKFLHSLRATHMPIREIRDYASSREKGSTGAPEQRAILEKHRRTLEEQISKLKEALALLSAKIERPETEGQLPIDFALPHPDETTPEPYMQLSKVLDWETNRASAFSTQVRPNDELRKS